ncbi:hypothetical protein PROFUN_04429 [Planoprotostelium fungivorum]|uniref:Uncharacterized protein n=1 Tax=Planoprotostelium fungivorum TaxID=1890364 RepID=A0A2P6NVK5_9EUKA|nr:hypothetical protein PROFUN_04429 [Planoprotostelium fungivorum]
MENTENMQDDEMNGDEAVMKEEKKPQADVEINPDDFPLDTYISNYSGYTVFARLLHIADHCKALELQALKLAHDRVKKTINTQTYKEICTRINSRLGSEYDYDASWVEQIDRKASAQLDKLENDLNVHRTNMIKENLRAVYNDFGDFYLARGDLGNALKSYVRMRDYCSSAKLMVDMCMSIIRVSIDINNFPHVANYSSKAEMTPDLSDKTILSRLKIATGLTHLEGKKYKPAARKLLETTADMGNYGEVASMQDVALYAGMCALATFDRQEMKKKVIDNSTFKNFMEVIPEMREAINDFYNSRYAPCLKRLDKLKPSLLLDIHLHGHVESLYQKIRQKAIIQYTSPFSSVDMGTMAEAFNTNIPGLEKELCSLIREGQVSARIDSHNKRLYARQLDQRSTTFERALQMGDEYEENTKAIMLRINMLRAEVIVKGPGRTRGGDEGHPHMMMQHHNRRITDTEGRTTSRTALSIMRMRWGTAEYGINRENFSYYEETIAERMKTLEEERRLPDYLQSLHLIDEDAETTRKGRLDRMHRIEGRLGPIRTYLDSKSMFGALQLRCDNLEVEGHSNFSSIRANVCVFKGKWMYEVTLGTAGIQQIGWATIECPFTNEEGVGDSADSYAYDGKRTKKWNMKPMSYGQTWATGDVIGSVIDLDKGRIKYYRNGESLGVAFLSVKSVTKGVEGMAYFPAFSLSQGERSRVNFGATPFQYPLEKYRSLQPAIPRPVVKIANSAFDALDQVLCISMSDEEAVDGLQEVCTYLSPLLKSDYIITSHVYPFLWQTFKIHPNNLARAIELLLMPCDEEESIQLIDKILSYVGYRCRITSLIESELYWFTVPNSNLKLMKELLSYPRFMSLFVSRQQYDVLEDIFTLKEPNTVDLSAMFPVVWWEGTQEEICDRGKMEESFEKLSRVMTEHEDLLYDISLLFINNEEVDPSASISPRNFFQNWMREVIKKNKGTNRNVQPPGLSDPTVLSNLYFLLLRLLRNFFTEGKVNQFPIDAFWDGRMEYFDFTRAGGALGHLHKTLPIQRQSDVTLHDSNPPITPTYESSEKISMEAMMFDCVVMLHHLGMSSRFKAAAIHMQNQISLVAQLEDTNKRMKRVSTGVGAENTDRLQFAKKIFLTDVIDHVRRCAWIAASLYNKTKQEAMFEMDLYLVSLLDHVSQYDPIFSYVPECYIEVLVDCFHALRRGDPPFPLTNDEKKIKGLTGIIGFFINHFMDKRIANPDLRDMLLQSISVLLQYHDFVRIMERDDVEKDKFMHNMLQAFDSRSWIPVANILLRFWKGTGFAQNGHKKGNDCSSKIYQEVFKGECNKDMTLCSEFINRIFNNLNWAITEFGVAALELQTATNRHYAAELQQHQRKCNVMFELSVCLTRIVELVTLEIPAAFTKNEINMGRLAELLIFLLVRTTSGQDSKTFESLLNMDIISLEKITRLAIFSPVVGITINIHGAETGKEKLSKMIATTGGFQLETFEYLLKFNWDKANGESVEGDMEGKLEVLSSFVDDLEKEMEKQTKKEEDGGDREEEELCAICCSAEVDTKFVPCGHSSCNRCIKRHMLNSPKCFFCNAQIESIEQDDKMEV